MDNKIVVDTLNDFKPMNNNVVIRHITDSIEDSQREEKLNSKIIVVRNEGNKNRERSVGQVVSTASELFTMYDKSQKVITPVDAVFNKNVIYDTLSRLVEIEIKEFPDDKFYLIRFPDIIALIEEE